MTLWQLLWHGALYYAAFWCLVVAIITLHRVATRQIPDVWRAWRMCRQLRRHGIPTLPAWQKQAAWFTSRRELRVGPVPVAELRSTHRWFATYAGIRIYAVSLAEAADLIAELESLELHHVPA